MQKALVSDAGLPSSQSHAGRTASVALDRTSAAGAATASSGPTIFHFGSWSRSCAVHRLTPIPPPQAASAAATSRAGEPDDHRGQEGHFKVGLATQRAPQTHPIHAPQPHRTGRELGVARLVLRGAPSERGASSRLARVDAAVRKRSRQHSRSSERQRRNKGSEEAGSRLSQCSAWWAKEVGITKVAAVSHLGSDPPFCSLYRSVVPACAPASECPLSCPATENEPSRGLSPCQASFLLQTHRSFAHVSNFCVTFLFAQILNLCFGFLWPSFQSLPALWKSNISALPVCVCVSKH